MALVNFPVMLGFVDGDFMDAIANTAIRISAMTITRTRWANPFFINQCSTETVVSRSLILAKYDT